MRIIFCQYFIFNLRCRTGTRVVGCCAHIAAVVWFLGSRRHEENPPEPSRLAIDILDSATQDIDEESVSSFDFISF